MDISYSATQLPDFLKALAHEMRWKILVTLSHSDRNVSELCRFLAQPQNVVSYHLRKLREQHVVSERRSSADSRDFYYSLEIDTFRSLYLATGETLHPALCAGVFAPEASVISLPTVPIRVLFLCTHNSARSQIAEGFLRQLGKGRIEVSSAGSQPSHLHPFAVRAMATLGIDISQQHSQHVDVFRDHTFDYVVTVCDKMREACPSFPGDGEVIHWSIPDPLDVEGTDEEHYAAFVQIAQHVLTRTRYFFARIVYEQEQRGAAS
jgi:protein-tyrosine-phosphatase